MSSLDLTEGRIRQLRLGGAIMDGGREMLQDAIQINLEVNTGDVWNEGHLFRRWCHQNLEFVQQFRFFKRTPKENAFGVEIPRFQESDLTLLSYLSKKVLTPKDLATIDKLTKIRNQTAHGVRVEISEEEFNQRFEELQRIAHDFFKSFPNLLTTWNQRFEKMKTMKQDFELLAAKFDKWQVEVRRELEEMKDDIKEYQDEVKVDAERVAKKVDSKFDALQEKVEVVKREFRKEFTSVGPEFEQLHEGLAEVKEDVKETTRQICDKIEEGNEIIKDTKDNMMVGFKNAEEKADGIVSRIEEVQAKIHISNNETREKIVKFQKDSEKVTELVEKNHSIIYSSIEQMREKLREFENRLKNENRNTEEAASRLEKVAMEDLRAMKQIMKNIEYKMFPSTEMPMTFPLPKKLYPLDEYAPEISQRSSLLDDNTTLNRDLLPSRHMSKYSLDTKKSERSVRECESAMMDEREDIEKEIRAVETLLTEARKQKKEAYEEMQFYIDTEVQEAHDQVADLQQEAKALVEILNKKIKELKKEISSIKDKIKEGTKETFINLEENALKIDALHSEFSSGLRKLQSHLENVASSLEEFKINVKLDLSNIKIGVNNININLQQLNDNVCCNLQKTMDKMISIEITIESVGKQVKSSSDNLQTIENRLVTECVTLRDAIQNLRETIDQEESGQKAFTKKEEL